MWCGEECPVNHLLNSTEISLEIAVVMSLTDSANSSSKRVIGRGTAQSPQPVCHPIPKAFAATGNEVCPSSHSDLTCDQAWNTATFLHSSLGIPQPGQALNFMRWLLPAQFQSLSPQRSQCPALTFTQEQQQLQLHSQSHLCSQV